MADIPEGAITIYEPIVFEIQTPTIPGLPTISTPPGIGLGGQAITIHYVCPLNIHCGSDTPCGVSFTLPLNLTLPLPVFSFPPQFNFPVFGFRFEIPPPLFIKCPAFEETDAITQKTKDEEGQQTEEEDSVDTGDGTKTASIKDNKTTVEATG